MRNQILNSQLQTLNDLLGRTHLASSGNIDLMGHWGRYLCVMTAGFLENALQILFGEYVQRRASPQVYMFAKDRLDRISNPKAGRFVETTRYFDRNWAHNLDEFLKENDGMRKDAVDSIMNNRNMIVHGQTSQISVDQVRRYLPHCVEVVDFIEDMTSG